MSLYKKILGQKVNVSLKEIKRDLISEAEVLIYQMKTARLKTDYESLTLKADSLTRICKKLELIRQEEERLKKEFNL